MLEFGQDISFVALVIVGMIYRLTSSGGNPCFDLSRLHGTTYPEHRFSSVTKSNIEMEH